MEMQQTLLSEVILMQMSRKDVIRSLRNTTCQRLFLLVLKHLFVSYLIRKIFFAFFTHHFLEDYLE